MQTISKQQIKHMNDTDHEDFVLINVLPPEKFRKQHIRTSINVPGDRDDFPELVELVAGGKARGVVVYCASEECDASPKAAKRLEQAGFTDVYDYEGGARDWFAQQQQAA